MTAARCPLCRRPAAADTAPFCSRGCRDRDLLAWFGEGYRIAGQPTDDPAALAANDGLDTPDGRD